MLPSPQSHVLSNREAIQPLAYFYGVTTGIHRVIRTKLVPQTTSPAFMPTKSHQADPNMSPAAKVKPEDNGMLPSPNTSATLVLPPL
ncbi:hypothetical protein V6N13_123364 [Hibiscus sabdariffa]